MNIFVAKLNFKTQTESLRAVFEEYGEVVSAKVVIDRETGRSKGFGFVEMANEADGQKAVDALNETEFDGATIVVKKALPKEEVPRRQGGFNNDRNGGGGNRFNNDRNNRWER